MRANTSRRCMYTCFYFLGILTGAIIHIILIRNHFNIFSLGTLKRLNNRIYISNQYYNSRGLLNDEFDEFEDMYPPEKKDQHKKDDSEIIAPTKRSKTAKKNKDGSRKIFLNCGGTFPWSLELFYDTFPDADEYMVHSFVHGKSYGSMYKQFPNHTLHNMIVGKTNKTVSKEIKCFGCGFPVSESVVKLDISTWIQKNTDVNDYVVVRMESEEETAIIDKMFQKETFDYIDKYYTTNSDGSVNAFLDDLLSNTTVLTYILTWNKTQQTYSDFAKVNPKSIPIKGMISEECLDANATERFALFLYSENPSVNSLLVIDMLDKFAQNEKLPITAFLPFQTLQFLSRNDLTNIFKTIEVGLYYNLPDGQYNVSTQLHRKRELSLRNTAIAAQNIVKLKGLYMHYIMYGEGVDNSTVQDEIDEYNYVFFKHGVDITHMIDYVLGGNTITMDMTGWEAGKYLMINMDVPHSEYLALYMVRRFIPWLMEAQECITSEALVKKG